MQIPSKFRIRKIILEAWPCRKTENFKFLFSPKVEKHFFSLRNLNVPILIPKSILKIFLFIYSKNTICSSY